MLSQKMQRYVVLKIRGLYLCGFMGSTAHWTLTYITTSTLHTNCYNSVNDSFAIKEPQVGLDWIYNLRIFLSRYLSIYHGIFAVLWDQVVHIGHCHTKKQLVLFICSAKKVPLMVLLQEPQLGPYWRRANLCSLKRYKDTWF